MYKHEVLVEQRFIRKTPMEILADIKLRSVAEKSEETLKALQEKKYQELIENHSFYFNWLKENSIVDYTFTCGRNDLFFSFKFKNAEDALAFKLRWI